MIGLPFLYIAVFLVIVYIQFSRQTSFSRKVGNFVVSGQMREPEEGDISRSSDEYRINEYAKVAFGGLDFILSNDADNPLLLVDEDGAATPLVVDTLKISNDTAHFLLSDGVELIFYTQNVTNTDGLLISGILPERASALQMPFLPSAFAKMDIDNAGRWTVTTNSVNYVFDRQPESGVDKQLVLRRDDPMVFYHAKPDVAVFNPATFIVRSGIEKMVYEDQLKQWTDKVYAAWEKSVSTTNNEMLVAAFLAEAARRGTYPSAQAAIPQSFRTSSAQTYLSAPFLGRLDIALRTLSAVENAQLTLVSELAREDSASLRVDRYGFDGWLPPVNNVLVKEQGAYANSIDISHITLSEVVDILEGYNNWPLYFPDLANPFERLIYRVLELVGEAFIKDEEAGSVFVKDERLIDVTFNLRLGLALSAYGDKSETASWAGAGRSLVLSVLALTDGTGLLPAFLALDNTGRIAASESHPEKIEAARLYPVLPLAVSSPRAVELASVQNGVWVWTVSPGINATFQNNVLDISVSFPIGWTHHLLVRGVPAFTKIQLRDMDYRSDPRFEQYNSPGWSYSASAQTLLVKLAHRFEEEHIRIFY
jgi:hypothetical protein